MTMLSEAKLAILEKAGDGDTKDLVREVRALREVATAAKVLRSTFDSCRAWTAAENGLVAALQKWN